MIYFYICLIGVGVQLIYDQELQTVSSKLSDLATKLHYDRDIKDDINRLARDGQQVAISFKRGARLAFAEILAGVNLNDADDCNRNIRRLRDEATSKRQQAHTLRTIRDTLEVEKRTLESQIRTFQTSSDELQDAADGLQEVSGFLRLSVNVINDILRAIETVQGELSELAAKLHYDRDIQDDINRLGRDDQQVATSFKRMLEADSSEILVEKNRLVKTTDPTDVKVDTMRKTFMVTRALLMSFIKNISRLEKDIHGSIETCNVRRKDHVRNKQTTEHKLETISIEITSLEDNIKTDDQSIGTLVQSAKILDIQADNSRRQAEQKRNDGIFGVAVGILAVLLVPYTGEAHLAISIAAVGVHVWRNLNDAEDCNRNARSFTDDATSKREEAQTLRTKRDTLIAERQALESQIRTLQTSSDDQQQAADGLSGVIGYLQSLLDVTDDCLHAALNIDTAMKEAELEGNTFEILQNWLASIPESVRAKYQPYLDKLKEKWTLEKILVQKGAKVSLT